MVVIFKTDANISLFKPSGMLCVCVCGWMRSETSEEWNGIANGNMVLRLESVYRWAIDRKFIALLYLSLDIKMALFRHIEHGLAWPGPARHVHFEIWTHPKLLFKIPLFLSKHDHYKFYFWNYNQRNLKFV